MAKLKHLLHLLASSFWPLPALLCLIAIGSAHATLVIDRSWNLEILAESHIPSPDGLRALLSTIATSFLTLAGLVFSSTLVALTLASSQYGPRVLHNFIHSRSNQFTFGVLLGNFLFSLIVLRQVRAEFLPQISSLVVFFLTLAGLGAFLFFVHRLVHSLRAENVIASVYGDLETSLDHFFPESRSRREEEEEAENEREKWEEIDSESTVASTRSGYIQRYEIETLVEIAEKADLQIRVLHRPGQLLAAGDPLVAIPASASTPEHFDHQINDAFVIGNQRTPEQDSEFALRQLVEIGSRSLSSGVNDPFTAINCIDLLAISLARIAKRPLPRTTFPGRDGRIRVKICPTTFRSLLEAAFQQLRHDGSSRPDITIRLFESLLLIGRSTDKEDCYPVLREFAESLREEAEKKISSSSDLAIIRKMEDEILLFAKEEK